MQPITIWAISVTTVQKYVGRFITKRICWRSTDSDDAKMLLEISFPLNCVIIDQLALNLVDICFDNMLQISCKSLLCLAKILHITQKSPKYGW